jgi:hypothetical protein
VQFPPKLQMLFLRRRERHSAAVGFLLFAMGCAAISLTAAQAPASASMDQVLGTVTASNSADKTFTVKEDKTGAEFTVSAENARRFLKVPPGEKDLKKAKTIDASQISVGDRLLARGHKDPSTSKLNALIVIVMTADDLQQKHQAELADWQKRGTHGSLISVDPGAKQLTMSERTPSGPETVTVVTTPNTQFTRYAQNSVKYADAKPSDFAALQPGDQLRVLGDKSADGTKITAEQILSGAFETVPATIVSISPDGKQMQATNIRTHQPITVTFTDDSNVRRLPPAMATGLARRMRGGSGRNGVAEGGAAPGEVGPGSASKEASAGPRPGGGANGDMSQMLERLPKTSLSDLKPREQVVISGGVGEDKSHLTAINVIAGVEPLFAAPKEGGGKRGGNNVDLSGWSLDVGIPNEQ